MKRIMFVVIALIMLLPGVVLADMGAPAVYSYQATVINPDGAMTYKWDDAGSFKPTGKVIPYGTTVTSFYETSGYAEIKEYDITNVKVTDLQIITDFKFDSSKIRDKIQSIALADLTIRTGPAEVFESTGTIIPFGTSFTMYEYDREKNSIWYYVDYNGVKGFVIAYNATSTLGLEDTDSLIMPYDMEYYEISNDSDHNKLFEKPSGIIEANTIIKTDIHRLDAWTWDYYLVYNGKHILVPALPVAEKSETTEYSFKKSMNIYSKVDADDIGKGIDVIGTIDKDTTVKSNYYGDFDNAGSYRYIYYNENGIKGWIIAEAGDFRIKDTDMPDEETEEIVVEEPTEPEEIMPEKQTVNTKDMIYTCVVVGAILCLTATATIVLINKKRKGKKSEVIDDK